MARSGSSTNRPDTFAQTQNTHHKDLACNLTADHTYSHGLDDDDSLSFEATAETRRPSHQPQFEPSNRKGLVTDVLGPKRNACPGTLIPSTSFCKPYAHGFTHRAFSLTGQLLLFLGFPSGREPGGVQRQSLKLPYAGWLPHERVSSQACLGLRAGVGRNSGPMDSRGSP